MSLRLLHVVSVSGSCFHWTSNVNPFERRDRFSSQRNKKMFTYS